MKRGYITASMDLPHEGHFRLLKACRQHCDFLTVGLATDDLCVKQKRKPLLSFAHRRSILENCKWVDLVVEHTGESKPLMHQKLHFDVLFSSDEYFGSGEMQFFEKEVPHIPVIYIPRVTHPLLSTTSISASIMHRIQQSTQVVACGVSGQILRQGFGPYFILKPIHFSTEECTNPETTADVLGFFRKFDALPRNYKKKHFADQKDESPPEFPMISGVSSSRELVINRQLQHKAWCTYLSEAEIFTKELPDKPFIANTIHATLLDFANDVCRARLFPTRIVHLIQREGGITFKKWCDTVCPTLNAFQAKRREVEQIIEELRQEGISHEDLHSRNVLVAPNGQLSVIDFGWSMSCGFQMCAKEQHVLAQHLRENFDLQHFRDSMEVCPATARWLDIERKQAANNGAPNAHFRVS